MTVCPQRRLCANCEPAAYPAAYGEVARFEIEMGARGLKCRCLKVKFKLFKKKEAPAYYENDIPAESQAEKKRTRLQKTDAYEERTQCSEEKTGQGKKKTHSIRDSCDSFVSCCGLRAVGMLKPDVLRNKKDFSALYGKGKSAGGKYVVLFYRKNNLGYSRKAFLASKKVGNSVRRNRARRLMRESCRLLARPLPTGYDLLFIARKSAADKGVKCGNVGDSIRSLLRRCGLLK
jgi:ribonuclease P protein component